jgi:vacuolar-type H+-ATPase subunit H
VVVRSDDAETIGRTLVLAQRAADQAIAEAQEQANSIRAAAEADALRARSDVELESARLLADARTEARRAGEIEREKVMGEVNALLARLEFLRDDVRAMEAYAVTQRDRLTVAAEAMRALAETEVGHAAAHHAPALSPVADQFRAEVLSPLRTAAPVQAQDPVKVAAAAVSAPSAGSTATVPFTVSYSEDPTGEVPRILPSSGPIAVPEFDDWNESPDVRIRLVRPKQNDPDTSA